MNTITSNIQKSMRYLVLLLLLLNASIALGQKNIYKAENEPIVGNAIAALSSGFTYHDPEIQLPNHVSFNPKTYVKLVVNSEIGPFVWKKTTVNLTITPLLPNGDVDTSVTPETKTLEVDYNPAGSVDNYIDLSYFEVVNRYGIHVVVDSFSTINQETGIPDPIIHPNVSMVFGFEAERYYQLTEQQPSITASYANDTDGTPLALNFNWTPLTGALEYELEWTWVDSYAVNDVNTILAPNAIPLSNRDFELNNTRIRTKDANYQIPLIYARGYVVYRIRAVGRFMDDTSKTYYGPWSTGSSAKTNVEDWVDSFIQITEHENDNKNWQFQASYAEAGKKKEVVSYFDGSLRNRQTVTKVNTNNHAVVGETVYDAQGRPAIEILPVPVNNSFIRFFKDLNKNNTTSPTLFTHLDFDWEELNATSCNTSINGMSVSSGSSQYYSRSNNMVTAFWDFIPDAGKYPFSQIEYTPDNTGRVSRKGGVGTEHQLGTKHEMKYFYSVPSQEELNRLFGYHVGYVSHYKKNIVVDPNGQVSVSYLDPQGRTVATALAGGTPTEEVDEVLTESLNPLEESYDSNPDHGNMTVDLLGKININDANTDYDNNELIASNNFSDHKDVLSLSKQIGVAGNNIGHKFKYVVKNNSYFEPDLCPEPYAFVYELSISVKDECGFFKIPEIANQTIGDPAIGNPGTIDLTINQPEQLPLPLFDTGNYSLVKELKVKKSTLESYANSYISKLRDPDNEECYIDPNVFATNVEVNCDVSCTECTASIGSEHAYVLKQLNGLYNVPAGTTPAFFTLNQDTFAVDFGTVTEESPINFGQQLNLQDVNGQIVQFRSQWTLLNAACEKLCGPTFASGCKINERALLKDVSPNGQYGLAGNFNTENDIPNVNSPVLSLFNENNLIIQNGLVNNNTTVRNHWRRPITPYLDDQGNQAYVEVAVAGPNVYDPAVVPSAQIVTGESINAQNPELEGRLFVRPEQLLNVSDFTGNFKESWGASLLPYHPEFCYLEYTRELCDITRSIEIYKFNTTPATHQPQPLTSDEYDGYLDYLDTYDKAREAGYLNFNSIGNHIFDQDPYFSYQLQNNFENANLFNWRRAIMVEAMNSQYEDNTVVSNNDTTAAPATLFKAAVMMARCNAIQTCDYDQLDDFSTLTEAEENKIWHTYKGLYKSLKARIKDVFMNVYAKSQGCYNGCIGEEGRSNLTSLLSKYNPAVIANINGYIADNSPTPVLCSLPEAVNYRQKDKRFVPIDFAYNADDTTAAALNALAALGNYQYYQQTGACPLINDLNLYLGGLFEDINLAVPAITAITDYHNIGQGLTAKLFNEFTGVGILNFPRTLSATELNLNISGGGKTLEYTFDSNALVNPPIPLILTIPTGETLTWTDYHGTSTVPGKWRIVGFSQLYYDDQTSDLNAAIPVFGYKVVARYVYNNSPTEIQDVVLYGTTIARIGECYVYGQGGGIGEELSPNTADCDKRQRFANGLRDLIIHLQELGGINNNYILSDDEYFDDNYLHAYFGVQPSATVLWRLDGQGYYRIYVNDVLRMELSLGSAGEQLNSNAIVNNLEIENNIGHDPHPIRIITTLNNNTTTLQGNVYTRVDGGNTTKTALYFACCAPCGEWDFNGDGSGDLCDGNGVVACSINPQDELTFENTLKDVLNYYLQPSNHTIVNGNFSTGTLSDISQNPFLSTFISQNSLQARFDNLRSYHIDNSTLPNGWQYYTFPAYLDKYSLSSTISTTRLSFNDGIFCPWNGSDISISGDLRVISEITSIDVISTGTAGQMKIEYINSNGLPQQMICNFSPLTTYKYGPNEQGCPSAGEGVNFCQFLELENYSSNNNKVTSGEKSIQDFDNVVVLYKDGVAQTAINARSSIPTQNQEVFHPNNSCNCIPQTVEPLGCDAMYTSFLLSIQELNIEHLNLEVFPTKEKKDFCDLNLQYLVEPYLQYLRDLHVDSTEHPNYLTITQFGHTDLNYGYANISEVIAAYAAYNSDPLGNPELYLWNNFVDLVYAPAMTDCPPPPMPTYSSPVEIYEPCAEIAQNISETYQLDSYNAYLNFLREEFIRKYIDKAMETVVENYDMTYADKEYQYTLYYYDQAGNLLKTVAPEGVNRFPTVGFATLNQDINSTRQRGDEVANHAPVHSFETQYKYNSLNQLVWQSTPDGGITEFAYDNLGRIIASQNANQKNPLIEEGYERFSYTKYDLLGRITEAGEVHVLETSGYSISQEGRLMQNSVALNEFDNSGYKSEVTRTLYDEDPLVENLPAVLHASDLFLTNTAAGFNPSHNNRNRVTGVYYYDQYDAPENYTNGIFYNYDIHGNVKEIVNYYSSLKGLECTEGTVINTETGATNDCEKHIKRIVYDYDLISGNVNTVTVQPNKRDQFIHKYTYDADNRIVGVETSPDGIIWEKDANYKYYPHGPLARVELGDKKVQGVDYAYTLHGWLKAVNGENLADSNNDMGHDGELTGGTKTRDAYGYSLNYYQDDYKAISLSDNGDASYKPLMFSRNNTIAGASSNLYNGNIKQMTTAIRKGLNDLLPVQKNDYRYDQLNRISAMTSRAIIPTTDGLSSNDASYTGDYSYDRNGNLRTLNQTAPLNRNVGPPTPVIDNFGYTYVPGTNRLAKVFDAASDTFDEVTGAPAPGGEIDFEEDIRNNIAEMPFYNVNNEDDHNYRYDAIGQLIRDNAEGITIEWRVDGKVRRIAKDDGVLVSFEYDGLGNRISKTVTNTNISNLAKTTTYYVRDAQGNPLSVYTLNTSSSRRGFNASLALKEHHLYGSSRLGLEEKDLEMYRYVESEIIFLKTAEARNNVSDNQATVTNTPMSIYTPVLVPVTRDYSLHFNTNTTATWPTLAAGQNPLSNPNINSFGLTTKLKFTQLPVFNGMYNIGQAVYQGTEQTIEDVSIPIPGEDILYVPERPDCVAIDTNVSTGTYTIKRVASQELEPLERASSTSKTDFDTCPIGPIEVIKENVLSASENGYLQYKIISTATGVNNSDVGFRVTTQHNTTGVLTTGLYMYKTVASSGSTTLYVVKNGLSTLYQMAVNDILKIEKVANTIKYYKNGVLLDTATIVVAANNTISNIDLYNNLKGKPARVNQLKFVKTDVNHSYDIKNQLTLSLQKSGFSYIPVINVVRFKTSQITGNTTKVNATFLPDLIPIDNRTDILSKGLFVDFNVTMNGTGSLVFNNDTNTLFDASQTQWYADLDTTLPATIANNIGGAINGLSATSFDMCYFNYTMGTALQNGTAINHEFNFDDVANTTFTSELAGQIQMTLLPANPGVVRLLGPCLEDTDLDGLYDLYEVTEVTPGVFYSIDTDGDGHPNHDDKDDDGDGIYTENEGANLDGDHNPNTGPIWNQNGTASTSNPNMVVNTIPNYLDVDDDGDGYATWETLEGGPGVFNSNTTSGEEYSLNTDEDEPQNYLDFNDIIYPTTGTIGYNSFVNLVGDKRYELSNHLGNVLSVINDKKIPTLNEGELSWFNADVLSYSDYYPFGMLIPNRHETHITNGHRYGFNGMEQDNEIKGEGNSYDFGARMFDPRIGRFFSVDPLERKYSMFSPYSAFANNPLFYVDKDGNENIIYVVNVPDGSGKKTMSDKELRRRINKANSILKNKAAEGGYELKTRYVLYSPHPNKIPYTKGDGGSLKRRYLDKTDGVILIGHAEDIKRYDRKNNITNFSEYDKTAGDKGWVPYRVLNGVTYNNPENTVPSTVSSDKRGGYIDTGTTDFDEQVFLMLHSAGHMSKTPNEGLEHRDYDNNGNPDPNIMMSGDARSEWLRAKSSRRTEDLWSSDLPANETFKAKMIRNFGDKPASDNYEKNIQKSANQIGPVKPDGTF